MVKLLLEEEDIPVAQYVMLVVVDYEGDYPGLRMEVVGKPEGNQLYNKISNNLTWFSSLVGEVKDVSYLVVLVSHYHHTTTISIPKIPCPGLYY